MSFPLAVGSTQQCNASFADTFGTPLHANYVPQWSSSNAAVATVNGVGLVTAVGPGTAIITATANGVSGSTTVTVAADLIVAQFLTDYPTLGPARIRDMWIDGVNDTLVANRVTQRLGVVAGTLASAVGGGPTWDPIAKQSVCSVSGSGLRISSTTGMGTPGPNGIGFFHVGIYNQGFGYPWYLDNNANSETVQFNFASDASSPRGLAAQFASAGAAEARVHRNADSYASFDITKLTVTCAGMVLPPGSSALLGPNSVWGANPNQFVQRSSAYFAYVGRDRFQVQSNQDQTTPWGTWSGARDITLATDRNGTTSQWGQPFAIFAVSDGMPSHAQHERSHQFAEDYCAAHFSYVPQVENNLHLALSGDSRAWGFNTSDSNTKAMLAQLAPLLPSTVALSNLGMPSVTIAQLNTRDAVDGLNRCASSRRPVTHRVAILWAAANDFALDNASLSTVEARYTAWVSTVRAAGFSRVYICTEARPSSGGVGGAPQGGSQYGSQSDINALNTWLRTLAAGHDAVIDLASDGTMWAPADYFDNIHPNDAGQARAATLAYNQLHADGLV